MHNHVCLLHVETNPETAETAAKTEADHPTHPSASSERSHSSNQQVHVKSHFISLERCTRIYPRLEQLRRTISHL